MIKGDNAFSYYYELEWFKYYSLTECFLYNLTLLFNLWVFKLVY